VSDRASFLRRAGAGLAAFSAAQLLGPAAARAAGGGGGDFPAHPRWRFAFVNLDTLDPLLVATQFGAQDAAALVECTIQWTGSPRGDPSETVRSLQQAIAKKADGIAVSAVAAPGFDAQVDAARRARIPILAFNVDDQRGGRRLAYVGENPAVSGARVAWEVARLSPRQEVALLAPAGASGPVERRLDAIVESLGRMPRPPVVRVVRLRGDEPKQEAAIEALVSSRPRLRGLYGVERIGTTAAGNVIKRHGLRRRGFHGGGYDLLPDDLALVAGGYLDFVVDQQPYVQGFAPVLQLFLAKISQGTVIPWDTETSVLLRKPDVAPFLATRSRFEGSSSRHAYPLRRA
jgi:simple sugar transport system substrate-binding protein